VVYNTLFIVRYSRKLETQRFENRIFFLPQVNGETSTLLGPLIEVRLCVVHKEEFSITCYICEMYT
jgi:hypothetical protein